MNFEHLIKFIKHNESKIKNKNLIKKIFFYYKEIILVNRQKLKLGSVSFEINTSPFSNGIYQPLIKIKFINQDQSQTPETTFLAILKFFKWEWTPRNLISFFLIFCIITNYCYQFLYGWILNNLSFLIEYDEIDIIVFKLGLEQSFPVGNFLDCLRISLINHNIVDLIFDFSLQFNLIL